MGPYYRIGDVARMLGEQPHTLRHWERQFRCPRPRRGQFGERLYTEEDIEVLRRIQHLLRYERYSVAEARKLFVPDADGHGLSPAVAGLVREVLQLLLLLLQSSSGASRR
jgi:DNA-binding transcriptional MerR regulator